jgi:hypothetical protein
VNQAHTSEFILYFPSKNVTDHFLQLLKKNTSVLAIATEQKDKLCSCIMDKV